MVDCLERFSNLIWTEGLEWLSFRGPVSLVKRVGGIDDFYFPLAVMQVFPPWWQVASQFTLDLAKHRLREVHTRMVLFHLSRVLFFHNLAIFVVFFSWFLRWFWALVKNSGETSEIFLIKTELAVVEVRAPTGILLHVWPSFGSVGIWWPSLDPFSPFLERILHSLVIFLLVGRLNTHSRLDLLPPLNPWWGLLLRQRLLHLRGKGHVGIPRVVTWDLWSSLVGRQFHLKDSV